MIFINTPLARAVKGIRVSGRIRETSEGVIYHISLGQEMAVVLVRSGFHQDGLYIQWVGTNLG